MGLLYLLDTNVLSELMRREPDASVLSWFASQSEQGFAVCATTRAEIRLGIGLLPAGKRRTALELAAQTMFEEDFRDTCLPFDGPSADAYARILVLRTKAGAPMSAEDAQIAAIALTNKLALVTRNTRDFEGIPNLSVIDPWLATRSAQ